MVSGDYLAGAIVLAVVLLAGYVAWFAPADLTWGDSRPGFRAVYSAAATVAIAALGAWAIWNGQTGEMARLFIRFLGVVLLLLAVPVAYATVFWVRRAMGQDPWHPSS